MMHFYATARTAAAWLALLIPGIAPAAPQPCTLCIEDSPRLTVGADGAASGQLALCNRGTVPLTLALTLSDFSATDADDKPFPLGVMRRLAAEAAADRGVIEGTAPLDPRCVAMKLEVSGVWQAGLSTATLRNGSDVLATVQAMRLHAPFAVKVDGPNPDRAELRIVGGEPFELRLRNEDEMGYRFRWRLELPGRPASGAGYVRPNRSVVLPVGAAAGHPVSWLESGFLRSATREGRLVVEYEPDPGLEPYSMPQKRYPVQATISAHDPAWQGVWNTFWIVFLLIIGIGASLLINYALPMQRRRVTAKQRLALLEGRLAGLGTLVPSRLLSQLRVEKKRLREELRQLWPVDPTTEAALPKFEAQIEWIDRRITLVVTAGEHLATLAGGTPLAVPQADQVRAACQTVFEIVSKPLASDDDIKRAQAALVVADTLRGTATLAPTAPMLQALGRSGEAVRRRVTAGANPVGHEAAFDELVTALLLDVPSEPPEALDFAAYFDMALAVAKAEVVADYKHLLAGAQSPEVRTLRTDRAQELLAALCPGPDESMPRARAILLEAEQGVSEADLVKALQCPPGADLRIDIDPPRPLPYQLVTLRVRLRRAGLDDAAARSRIECVWGVSGSNVDIESKDWEASCFFEQPRPPGWLSRAFARLMRRAPPAPPLPITVKASLRSHGAQSVEVPPHPVVVEPPKSYAWASAWLSLGSTFVTMLLAGIGLVAGAQEKIQSLDWVAGVFAILALGFGADVLKRVLTRP